MQDVLDQLSSDGFEIGQFIPDGKLHRFASDSDDKRRSAYYIGHQNFKQSDGQLYYVVVYGSWKTGVKKHFSTMSGDVTPEDRRLEKEQRAKAQAQAEKERAALHEEAAEEAQRIWDGLSEQGYSEYLITKKIKPCPELGVRYDHNGKLFVPVRDGKGKLWSFQSIDGSGAKRFYPGARVVGNSHIIGSISQDCIYVAEGFSTSSSIFLATGRGVVCAFSASSIGLVVEQYRKNYPDAHIVICGDDDLKNPDNPGRKAAEEAAKKYLCAAVLPRFQNGEGTDFNDLHVAVGLAEVRKQIEQAQEKAPKHYFLPLGLKEKEYFFTSSHNQQIVGVTSFSKTEFLNLMPIEYWEAVFPGSGQSRVNWDTAISKTMESARAKGIFESQNIRGAGVWEDDGRVVVNMGDHLIVDGKTNRLGEIKSRYFYTLGTKLPGLHPSPLTAQECDLVLNACEKFKWKKKDFGPLLAGAMVTTRVCGALPIRPHVWLTGERGSGKTTLFNRLIYPLIGQPLIFAGGNSTEAGIRQEVSANAVPVLFDEFENNGQKSAESIQSVLDLMRLSWSDTQASIIKGSSSGVASTYRARFAAIVTSIRQVSMSDADRSRFATLELDAHESDMDHWGDLDAALNRITPEVGSRLFARTIKLLPVLLSNFRAMKAALNRKSPGQRFGDQYGMLLAGTALLTQDGPITAQEADAIAGFVGLEEEREAAAITDHGNALSHLLTWKLSYEADSGRREDLVADLVESARLGSAGAAGKALNLIGIKVHTDRVDIASGDHAELAKIYRGTQWDKAWGNSLVRLTGAERSQNRIAGQRHRCIQIPLIHFKN